MASKQLPFLTISIAIKRDVDSFSPKYIKYIFVYVFDLV